jgi:phosphatidate cytidylyltransferase
MSKNLIARIAVAAVFIPAILWVCYQGGAWLLGMLTFFALIGIIEFMVGEKIERTSVVFWYTLFFVGLWFYTTLKNLGNAFEMILFSELLLLSFFVVSGLIVALQRKPPDQLMMRVSRLTWGVLYICLLYPTVYGVSYAGDMAPNVSGGDFLLFLFGLLWIGDTAAMGIGAWIGRHKLAPTVSPNKTIEGFIGGIIGAIAVGILMYSWKLESLGLVHVLALAIGCSIFGQLGDLVESMWKRSVGIKDSSAIIPGHGGILDRFDSLLFAAPFMFGYLVLYLRQ